MGAVRVPLGVCRIWFSGVFLFHCGDFCEYGFCVDPKISIHENCCNITGNLPCWFYFTQPTNMSCHNLKTTTKPPKNFKALLGLGLNFCPTPRYTTYDLKDALTRFKHNLYNHYLYHRNKKGKKDEWDPRYHIRGSSTPETYKVHREIRARFALFKKRLQKLFLKKRVRSNLLQHQTRLLQFLIKQHDLLICSSDKNLGPCIIERRRYVDIAFADHLDNKDNYQPLTKNEAMIRDLRKN